MVRYGLFLSQAYYGIKPYISRIKNSGSINIMINKIAELGV